MSRTPAYDELTRAYTRIHRYNHLAAIVGWDRNAMMPPKGNEARAAAEAELAALIHRARTDPRLAEWIRAADGEPLDDTARANLREIRRDWRDANALPESLPSSAGAFSRDKPYIAGQRFAIHEPLCITQEYVGRQGRDRPHSGVRHQQSCSASMVGLLGDLLG